MEVESSAKQPNSESSFTQEVVREAFGEDLYTEHVKITIKNDKFSDFKRKEQPKRSEFKTFKQTYFGKSQTSMDENPKIGGKNYLLSRD